MMNTLLICNPSKSYWTERLLQALGELTNIIPISAAGSAERVKKNDFDLIIIDKSGVEDVNALIKRLKPIRSNLPIVVAAEVPTWQEARAAFQAGAADVVSSTMSPEELGSVLREITTVAK